MAQRKPGQGGTQVGLPGMEWSVCKCGCGTSFLQGEKGRKRDYYNDSHKKRAFRDRLRSRQEMDAFSAALWNGVLDSLLDDYAAYDADEYHQQWAQYEILRRARS